ncbi:ubiquitin carboxyl-terminal hydrolase 1 [Dorcoceras hygrometricum]|uniref:Ubiquitin carboxyl-terminal hydrolase 1 n=1 Tax=Dorcoceras hygrometricum TaxID=472368 RepID=A0A2Z6ZSM3_9LAMI|nr:ubiquitin carboxyl-terminal hydrolase 1 [Dorcoceras hygrometricum]
MTTAIHFGIQICLLLNGDPTVMMGEATTFPPFKILSAKTVKTYVATNETIDARGKSDEPDVAKIARSKKRPIATDDDPAVTKKKRTSKRKASSSKDNMDIVSVAQEAIPLQTFESSTAVSAEQSPVPK